MPILYLQKVNLIIIYVKYVTTIVSAFKSKKYMNIMSKKVLISFYTSQGTKCTSHRRHAPTEIDNSASTFLA